MRITQIDIKNYRAIKDISLTLDEHDDFLVLAGLNGSGKSSVLEAILTALGSPFEMREPLKGQEYEVSVRYKDGLNDGCFNAKAGEPKCKNMPSFGVQYCSSWRAPKRVHGVALKVGKKGRRPDNEVSNALWKLKQWLVSLPTLANFPSWRDKYDKVSQVNEEVNRMWQDFYPDRHESFEADIEEGGMDEMSQMGSAVEPKFELYLKRKPEDGGRISVDELSSGEIELLSLFGTLIVDKVMKGRPTDFVFLDEPELHLNPVWHRMLVPMLKKYAPGTQFFIATHSLPIWNSVYGSERVFLRNGCIEDDHLDESALTEGRSHG